MRMGTSLRQQTVVLGRGRCRFDGPLGGYDGAAGLQVGTAYLLTESEHRRSASTALKKPRDDLRVLTNLFTGSPALPC